MLHTTRLVRRGLTLLAGLLLTGILDARQRDAELMSDPKARAFVGSLLTWEDHGVLAWYGGAQEQNVIHLQRLDPALGVYSRPIVLSDPTRAAYEPSLTTVGTDTVVAWYEKSPDSGEFYALIARLDWSGHVKWHGSLAREGHSARNPVVRAAPDGIWVAWLEGEEGDATGVWIEHLSTDGQPLAPAQRAGVADRATAHLNAAVDTAGAFYVVFDAKLESRAPELRLVTADAQSVQQRTLTRDDGAASVFPDIAIDGERVALCWVDARAGHDAVLAAVVGRADLGAALDTAAVTLTHGTGEVGGSYLAWNKGRLGVAWNGTGASAGVYLQRLDVHGRPAGAATQVARTAAPARAAVPVLAPWQKGFAIAWNEYTEDAAAHRVLASRALQATLP
jgi:hypothetical protein